MTADEAKAIIDRFAVADSSLAAIAAVAKQLIDQVAADAQALSLADRRELEEWRAKAEVERIKNNERQQRHRSRLRHGDCHGDVTVTASDASPARARSSSSFLESKKEGGGGVCAREGARDTDENKIILKAVDAADPEEVAAEVEQTVKRSGVNRWPEKPTEGWMRANVVPQIAALLRAGVARNVILEAVRVAAESYYTGNAIGSFKYFINPIMRAHAAATAQLALPLNNFKSVPGGTNEQRRSSSEQRFASRHAARTADRPASGGIDIEVGVPMDATETG